MISFNDEFTSKFKRIKVPLVSIKDSHMIDTSTTGVGSSSTIDQSGMGGMSDQYIGYSGGNGIESSSIPGGGERGGGIPASVEEDRRHLAEATVVRIMKVGIMSMIYIVVYMLIFLYINRCFFK